MREEGRGDWVLRMYPSNVRVGDDVVVESSLGEVPLVGENVADKRLGEETERRSAEFLKEVAGKVQEKVGG